MIDPETDLVLILAAGKGERWGSASNKVLVDINGEPLLNRTRRLAHRVFGIEPYIVSHSFDIERFVPGQYHDPDKRRWTVETLMSTESLWTRRVFVLLGDTYYTINSLWLIKNSDKLVCFFGRLLEIYALSFGYHETIKRAADVVISHAESSPKKDSEKGKLWHLWYALNGYSLDEHTIPPAGDSRFMRLNDSDITMDVDKLEDYQELLRRIK